jgi:ADP-heptose:LPS heptosyltransferase
MQTRILAIHPGALGDVILFGHLLSRLGASITIIAGREKADLLVGAGIASTAVDFDSLPMHEVFSDMPSEKCRLPGRLGEHDRLISCFGGEGASGLRLAAFGSVEDAAFLPVRPGEEFSAHLMDLWMDMLGVSWNYATNPPKWTVPQAWRIAGSEAIRQAGLSGKGRYFLIHPGAGSSKKCWPLENFRELSRELRGRGDVAWVLGPVECDWWAGKLPSLRAEVPVLLNPPLTVLAGALAGAECFVGNDSGVSHLAAAVGAPTVALFGPTRWEQFSPLGERVKVVQGSRMEDTSFKEVLSAAESMIQSTAL